MEAATTTQSRPVMSDDEAAKVRERVRKALAHERAGALRRIAGLPPAELHLAPSIARRALRLDRR